MKKDTITIKELHEKTGELVRQAAQAHKPVPVTDRGKVVAMLVAPKLVKATRRIRRVLPKDYLAMMANLPRTDVVVKYLQEERER